MLKIGLDIDGVVYPWHYSIYRYFTEFKRYEGSQVDFWKMFKTLTSDEQKYYVSIPLLYRDTIPSRSVLNALNLLAAEGELFYITSRAKDELKDVTGKFFDEYEAPFKENIFFYEDKATACRLLRMDFFVDDLPRNVAAVKGVCRTFLMKAPHNVDERDGFDVVDNLNHFYEEIMNETKRSN